MFRNLLHNRCTCLLFTAFLIGLPFILFKWLPTHEQTNTNGRLIIILTSTVSWVAAIAHIVSLCIGMDLDAFDLSKPHKAVLYKRADGRFEVRLTQFPVHSWTCPRNQEANAVSEYNQKKDKDTVSHQVAKQRGAVRVIATPSGETKIHNSKEAFEHIEAILKQYAPEQADAIRKVADIFNNKN